MTKSKILKILLGIFAVLFVAFLVVIFSVVKSLPSPQEISSAFKKSSEKATEPIAKTASQPTDAQVAALQKSADESVQKAAADPNKPQVSEAEKARIEGIIKNLLKEDRRDIRVCDNLGKGHVPNKEEKNQINFDKIFGTEERTDSFSESIRIPLKAVFQEEHLMALFDEIFKYQEMNISQEEQQSFLAKAGFYSRLAMTVGYLYQKRAEFEKISDRATHLRVLAQLALKKPEMANDSRVSNLCRELENSIATEQDVDVRQERSEILKTIEYAGLKPADLDFDPNQYVKFGIQSSKDGINFSLDDSAAK